MAKKKILSITFLASVLALSFINPCLAIFERAILSKISITPQSNGTYKILIKTDREVPFNKITASENKIVIDIKNVKASKFVNTVYNNALGVEHVIVQPVSDNRVKIFIEGEKISRSNIVVDSRRGFPVFEGVNKDIDYSKPVYYNNQSSLANKQNKSDYNLGLPGDIKPVEYIDTPVPLERPVVNQFHENTQQQNEIIRKPQPAKSKLVDKQANHNSDASKASRVNNAVNNLNSQGGNSYTNAVYANNRNNNYNNQEKYQHMNYYNNSKSKSNYPPEARSAGMPSGSGYSKVSALTDGNMLNKLVSLDIFDWGLRFLILAFIIVAGYKLFFRKQPKYTIDLTDEDMRERELALLKSMNEKYAATGTTDSDYERKPSKKGGYSSFTQYGLSEYQNSQLPPGNRSNRGKKSIGGRKRQVQASKPSVRKPVQAEDKSEKSRVTDRESEKINIDNKKFLEKMATIYEKSGRSDLAEGIQNNIKKRTIM